MVNSLPNPPYFIKFYEWEKMADILNYIYNVSTFEEKLWTWHLDN